MFQPFHNFIKRSIDETRKDNRDGVCAPCDVVNVIGDRSTRRLAQAPLPFLARLETRVEDAALLQ
jgi:hypothetical protein